MKALLDERHLRISMIRMLNGDMVSTHAAEAWQEPDGSLSVSGIWSDLVPYAKEDHALMAEAAGVSSLEWLYRRLLTCPLVSLEIIDQ
jgi:hypothetical protein